MRRVRYEHKRRKAFTAMMRANGIMISNDVRYASSAAKPCEEREESIDGVRNENRMADRRPKAVARKTIRIVIDAYTLLILERERPERKSSAISFLSLSI